MAKRLILISVTAAMLLFGLVMVFSASSVVALAEHGDAFYQFKRQALMVAIGLVGLVGAAVIPYRFWLSRAAWAPWAVVVFLLALTLVMGDAEQGARRWLTISGFSFQPSEFAKIAMMLLAAMLVVRLHDEGITNNWMVRATIMAVVPAGLIALQPDLGTLAIALVGVVVVAWFGEIPLKAIGVFLACAALLALGLILTAGFRQSRLESFLNPWADPLGSGYQIINSYFAFGDGGLFGVGLGMSHQKYYYLPMAENDFIFAIIGEELGLIGALAVVALFLVFLFVSLRIARQAPDLFGRCLAGTSAILIVAQAFLNILCVTGLFPITGKPLPFFSSGGTSMIATLILVGLILSVSLRSEAPSPAARRDNLMVYEGGRARTQPAAAPAAVLATLLSAIPRPAVQTAAAGWSGAGRKLTSKAPGRAASSPSGGRTAGNGGNTGVRSGARASSGVRISAGGNNRAGARVSNGISTGGNNRAGARAGASVSNGIRAGARAGARASGGLRAGASSGGIRAAASAATNAKRSNTASSLPRAVSNNRNGSRQRLVAVKPAVGKPAAGRAGQPRPAAGSRTSRGGLSLSSLPRYSPEGA
ncbi:MAG: putative lipid II flippase FtsW [Coriobacteriales bacterium]|nr:putative lipid II flippase FtsW [Coriobacteriales bacterium]